MLFSRHQTGDRIPKDSKPAAKKLDFYPEHLLTVHPSRRGTPRSLLRKLARGINEKARANIAESRNLHRSRNAQFRPVLWLILFHITGFSASGIVCLTNSHSILSMFVPTMFTFGTSFKSHRHPPDFQRCGHRSLIHLHKPFTSRPLAHGSTRWKTRSN